MIMKANPVGFHTTLTPSVLELILSNVEGNYVTGQVARVTCIPRTTLITWIKKGREDAEKGINSIFAQLTTGFEQRRGYSIFQMLNDVKERKPNWQAPWELLKTIAREDFGIEAVEYKELLDLYTNLSQAFKRFTENPLQVQQGGCYGKLDSGSDKEAGGA